MTIVGYNSHYFEGTDDFCEGVLGGRYGNRCSEPREAKIHTKHGEWVKNFDAEKRAREVKVSKTPKYKVGDRVLIETEVVDVTESSIYAGHVNIEYRVRLLPHTSVLRVLEEEIIGLAPMKEPTKIGTVVVVGDAPYTLTEEGWVYPFMGATPWEELIKHGTPKVVWEPEG